MKKVAIIGANGMLGSDLASYLSSSFLVTGITKQNYTTYRNSSFDIVINANGNSKRFWANQNILEDFALSTTSVYNTIFDFPTSYYIYISSSDVYHNHTSPLSTKEESEIKIEALSPYGLHKYFSEQLVKRYAKKFLILRSSMILGSSLKKGPIFDILHNNELFISKDSYLQMISTKAIADLIQIFIKKNMYRKIVNMGGRGAVSVHTIKKILQMPITFSSQTEKQAYEMNTELLEKVYSLKQSQEYLAEFIREVKTSK